MTIRTARPLGWFGRWRERMRANWCTLPPPMPKRCAINQAVAQRLGELAARQPDAQALEWLHYAVAHARTERHPLYSVRLSRARERADRLIGPKQHMP